MSYSYAGTNRIRFRGFLQADLRLSQATPKVFCEYSGTQNRTEQNRTEQNRTDSTMCSLNVNASPPRGRTVAELPACWCSTDGYSRGNNRFGNINVKPASLAPAGMQPFKQLSAASRFPEASLSQVSG